MNELAERPPLEIVSGEGVHITDSMGRSYIDGQGGLWNVNAGHGREEIKEAIRRQLDKLSYYSLFGGTTTAPAVELAELLCEIAAPEGMARAFFSSGGSDANETAIKLARLYWRRRGQPGRTKFISLRRAYHGVSLGALSAIGIPVNREAFEPLLPGFRQVETPHLYRNVFGTEDHEELGRICARLLEQEIEYQGAGSVAAFIAEPVQGAGGVIVPPANFWPLVREICDRHGVLLIADEVVTGFGRIGSMTGCRHWGVKPDMMTFAKGINSGYVPLGATLMSAEISEVFAGSRSGSGPNVFPHGNTYAGHPLACAAAIANLGIVVDEDLAGNARTVGAHFIGRLRELQARHPNIGDVRGLGLMVAMEMVGDRATAAPFEPGLKVGARIAERCREYGLLVRNIGDTFIISPPLILTREQADEMADIFDRALSDVLPQ